MTTMLMERLPGFGPAGEEHPTLDEAVVGLWEELSHSHPADCPFCDGTLRPVPRQLGRAVAARCDGCFTLID